MFPFRLGRFCPQLKTTLQTLFWPTVMLRGAPLIAETMPDICHPPNTPLAKWLELLRKTGRSYTKLMKAPLVRLKTDCPMSYFHPAYGLETFCRSAPLPVPVVGSSERDSV